MRLLQTALEQARLSLLSANPNPRVGCILCNPDGVVLGSGHTQAAGSAHAEVMALRDAAAKGFSVKGATAYVTLEPCSHHGRTPPCCDALITAGVAKVVVAVLDPNPLVAGRGVQRLRAAGIEVTVLPADSAEAMASRELNIGFFSRMLRQTPWVRLKMAASLDGTTALANGASQWITGQAARADGHAWRARACAVLTGIGTVLQDDPLLNVRHVDTPRQPHLVVVDSRLEIALTAQLFAINSIAARALFIYSAGQNGTKNSAYAAKKQALEARGVTVMELPEKDTGKVDLQAMLRDLAHREVNELHVEAGFKLNGSLFKAGVVDEVLLYTAPKLLGAGQGLANMPTLHSLTDAVQLDFQSVDRLGEDLRMLARVRGRDKF